MKRIWRGMTIGLLSLLGLSCIHYVKIPLSELVEDPESYLSRPIAIEAEVEIFDETTQSRHQKLEYNPYPLFLPDQPWVKGYRLTREVRTRTIRYRISGVDNIFVRQRIGTEPFPPIHRGKVRIKGSLAKTDDGYILNASFIEPAD